MRAFAPGKLVLTGAYAVLEGAPAIAVAVDRGALADASRAGDATPEVAAALGPGERAPRVEASAMFAGDRKLGLGASAAILVASLAALDARRGAALSDPTYREDLFSRARDAHARAQSGGSGVDVATSVYGGAIRYVVGRPVERVALPAGLRVSVFACDASARTSELRAKVDRLAVGDPRAYRATMGRLIEIAEESARALEAGEGAAFVAGLQRTARALADLGVAAGAGIVPDGFEDLEAIAASEGAAFTVSGAGGGDVAVYVGPGTPSAELVARARARNVSPVELSLDEKGVRTMASASALASEALSSTAGPT